MATEKHNDSHSDHSTTEDNNSLPAELPLQLESLPAWATTFRRQLIEQDDPAHSTDTSVECTQVMPPISGSFNIVFPLQFNDGVRWALKVPEVASPDTFNASAAQALVSEALTMQLLKRETTIPVPRVHGFHAGLDNSLQYPFILMDFVDGVLLPDVWFDQSIPQDLLDTRRLRVLEDIAKAMVQLGRFTFQQAGSLRFDSQGNVSEIAPMRAIDTGASLAAKDSGGEVMCDLGPFGDATSYLHSLLNRRESPPDTYSRGLYILLRHCLEWLPELEGYNQQKFVLSHPDFDIQNILVTQDGRITGIIDWEGVVSVPECLGNLCYPSFLTRELDPMAYSYDPEGAPEDNEGEDSPKELQRLRKVYLEMVERALSENNPSSASSAKNPTRWTRRSLVIENLKIAADNPTCTHGIMGAIFDKIKEVLSKEPQKIDVEDLFLYDIACELVDGTLDEGILKVLKKGFLDISDSD